MEVLDKLSEIQKTIDSIDAALSDQFQTVDGFTYSSNQSWTALVNIRETLKKIDSNVASTQLAAWIAAIALIAYVVHRW